MAGCPTVSWPWRIVTVPLADARQRQAGISAKGGGVQKSQDDSQDGSRGDASS